MPDRSVGVSAESPAVDGALEAIRDHLLSREYLYDHPGDYRDGVAAAIEAIRNARYR